MVKLRTKNPEPTTIITPVVVLDADNTLYPTKRAARAGYTALYEFVSERTGISKQKLKRTHKRIIQGLQTSHNPSKRSKKYSIMLLLEELTPTKVSLGNAGWKIFWNAVISKMKPAASARAVIKRLSGEGFTLIIASDEFRAPLRMKLEKTLGKIALSTRIHRTLITPERTGSMKPSKKYCELAFKQFRKVPPARFVFVGDSWERDLKLAKGFGAKTVLVSQSKSGNPDCWVKSIRSLPKTLKNLF